MSPPVCFVAFFWNYGSEHIVERTTSDPCFLIFSLLPETRSTPFLARSTREPVPVALFWPFFVPSLSCEMPIFQGAPVRFGSVTVWGWNGSSGSGLRFRRFLCRKGVFCVSVQFNRKGRFQFRFRFLEDGSGGFSSAFGSFENQEPRKGGLSKGGFCRIRCHFQEIRQLSRILGSAVHSALGAPQSTEAYMFAKTPFQKPPFLGSWENSSDGSGSRVP